MCRVRDGGRVVDGALTFALFGLEPRVPELDAGLLEEPALDEDEDAVVKAALAVEGGTRDSKADAYPGDARYAGVDHCCA